MQDSVGGAVVDARQRPTCPACAGTGKVSAFVELWGGNSEDPCGRCAGLGSVEPCAHCGGVGQMTSAGAPLCPDCHGAGYLGADAPEALTAPAHLWFLVRTDAAGAKVLVQPGELTVSERLYIVARAVRLGLVTAEQADVAGEGWRLHAPYEVADALAAAIVEVASE